MGSQSHSGARCYSRGWDLRQADPLLPLCGGDSRQSLPSHLPPEPEGCWTLPHNALTTHMVSLVGLSWDHR